ncbi:MAG: transposase [Deltaproteobacteria bacterium]|nr:transposase [Deltaproteobacteria bacterium]
MKRKYLWRYLYSFVRPETGSTINYIGSTVSAEAMSEVLRMFALDAGIGPKRHAVVVIDGAGWHRAKDLVVPEGVHLVFLPPYSPELQPAERIWPIVNEGVANRGFADLAELTTAVEDRCRYLDDHQDFVCGLTNFHWWPKESPCKT